MCGAFREIPAEAGGDGFRVGSERWYELLHRGYLGGEAVGPGKLVGWARGLGGGGGADAELDLVLRLRRQGGAAGAW